MSHEHLHTHSMNHPDAFGHTVTVSHDHAHQHVEGTRMATFGEGSHHRMHKHTKELEQDLRRQQRGGRP